MTLEITATAPKAVEVKLVGKFYNVTPPKTALSLNLIENKDSLKKDPKKVLATINGWIDSAFSEKDAKEIRKRLNDGRDLLDISHITELVKVLFEHQTENPTTSDSD